MLSVESYLENPCGTLSIPYWKHKKTVIPENMKIIHEKDFINGDFNDYNDEPYFRLYHNMKDIEHETVNDVEILSGISDINEFVQLINRSYVDLSVTAEQLEDYKNTPVFCSELWILLKEKISGEIVAGGIADYDRECKELILEWIQVIPTFRGYGYGKTVVNSLLSKMKGIAEFATVSGKVNNPTDPEGLYRRCGFMGDDVWHILTQKG